LISNAPGLDFELSQLLTPLKEQQCINVTFFDEEIIETEQWAKNKTFVHLHLLLIFKIFNNCINHNISAL